MILGDEKRMDEKKRFGDYVSTLRKKQNISLGQLCDGLCSESMMSRIEAGERAADKLLQDRLLGRLGVVPENYENFLYYREYKRWKERQNIVVCILNREIDKARMLLEEYQNHYSMENKLERQFYLTMLVQIRRLEKAERNELKDLFEEALLLSVPEVEEREWKPRILSTEELNLLIEYVYYTTDTNSLDRYEKLFDYIEAMDGDELTVAKVYPKTVFYYYEAWRQKKDKNRVETAKLVKLCERMIEILRKAHRMFYLWELLGVKKQLLQNLLEETTEGAGKEKLEEKCEEAALWQEVLESVYEEYGVSKTMEDFAYFYVDREAYCIGDVIRIRRKMFGMTMQELSDGICSERTISRLERNETEPQREIVQLLFERLNMAPDFCRTELITSNPEAKKQFAELKYQINNRNCEEVDRLLTSVKGMVPLDIPTNRQLLERHETINKSYKGQLSKEGYLNEMKKTLEYTIPYDVVVTEGEKYLTLEEIACIQNITVGIDWTFPEMKQCVETLYDLFEHQKQIEDCLNMYEFVMTSVSSCLGNNGEYARSDSIKIKTIVNALKNYRTEAIHGALYGLLWNDEKRKKEKLPQKRGVDFENGLKICKIICQMDDAPLYLSFYRKKLDEIISSNYLL